MFDDFSPAVMAKYNPKERYDMHYSMAVIRNPGIEKLVCGVGLTPGILGGVQMDFDYWVKWRYTGSVNCKTYRLG